MEPYKITSIIWIYAVVSALLHHHQQFNGCFLGEPALASSSSFFIFHLFWKRTFGNKWHSFFYRTDALPVIKPTVVRHKGNSKHWPQPMAWTHPFCICHWIPEGKGTAPFMLAFHTGWNKFRQLVPLHTNRDISLIRRGRLYSSCVWSSMLHGSETWPVRKENEVALQQTEIRMVRWMCNVKVKDKVPSKELRER